MPGNNGNQWSLGMQADSVTISRDKPFQWGGSSVNKSSQFHRFSLICVGFATSTFDEPIEVTATSVVQANACHTINKKSFSCL